MIVDIKCHITIIIVSLTILTFSLAQKNTIDESDFPVLEGLYLGQNPPGMTPEIFAPGIVSTDVSEGCVSFTHDNTLFLFARSGKGILLMQKVNGRWTAPKLAPFSVGECDWDF